MNSSLYRNIPYDQYYLGVLHLTGSELFNKRIRKHAQDMGYILSQNRFCKLGSTGINNRDRVVFKVTII